MKTILFSPEALESRIAPAQFFLSGTAFDVVDKNGASVNDTASAGLVGADLAVLVKAGDTLILDTNGNHVLDTGEVVFAKVTGGKALVFAKNMDMDTTVDPDEITSLAVSDGFKGAITGDLRGSVVTSLPTNGAFDPTKLLDASIAGLSVTGLMHGQILAGKNISNVQVETDFHAFAGMSVEGLRCGTAANGQTVSYDAGATTKTLVFTFSKEGEAGGSITNVTLGHGGTAILAGAGNDSKIGNAGHGGSITGLTFVTYEPTAPSVDLDVRAGAGGRALGADGLPPNPVGNGGAGGSLGKIQFESDYLGSGNLTFAGGDGGGGKKGGAGGGVKTANMHLFGDSLVNLTVIGGRGAEGVASGSAKAPGGAGGAITDVHVIASNLMGFITLQGGAGEDGVAGGGAGNGGAMSKLSVQALVGAAGVAITGGDGGTSSGKTPGGKGGSITATTIETGDLTDRANVIGGRGGNGTTKGGTGGSVSGLTLKIGDAPNGVNIHGRVGGFGASGGAGGSLSNITADVGEVMELEVLAGDGGPSKTVLTTGIRGGAGGAVKNVTLIDRGMAATKRVTLESGRGGEVFGGSGNGGAGGSITGVKLQKLGGGATDNSITARTGGDGSGKGSGGNGGNITNATYEGSVVAANLHIGVAEPGGESGMSGLRGGKGGSMSKITVKADGHAFTGVVLIDAGGGGAAKGTGGRGGDAGSVKTVALDLLGSTVRINGNSSFPAVMEAGLGGAGVKAVGGTGGDVSGVTGRVGILVVDALTGGDAPGKGGRGGNVSNVNLTEVSSFVRQIRAGDGGYAPKPGRGGNISGITVPGDIGQFTALFDTDHYGVSGMGGLLAGEAGGSGGPIDSKLSGSVTRISAMRIAAILAGDANASSLTKANAASSISKITATKIGAEPVLTPGFDFVDADGDMTFQLGDDDTALDGLVIVLAGKATLPVTPLKLIEV